MSQQDSDREGECQCPDQPRRSLCDGDIRDNVWFERADETGIGVCLLDTMQERQVIYSIERDDRARKDLLRVTTDEHLRELALTIPKLPSEEEADVDQRNINRSEESIPFYSAFRGQPPFAQ